MKGAFSGFHSHSYTSTTETLWRIRSNLYLEETGSLKFDPSKIAEYVRRVKFLLRRLTLLDYMIGVQPARGTEFLSLEIQNTWISMRGFHIQDHTVRFLIEYHKGQFNTNAPKVVARFVSSTLTQVYVTYVIIQPTHSIASASLLPNVP